MSRPSSTGESLWLRQISDFERDIILDAKWTEHSISKIWYTFYNLRSLRVGREYVIQVITAQRGQRNVRPRSLNYRDQRCLVRIVWGSTHATLAQLPIHIQSERYHVHIQQVLSAFFNGVSRVQWVVRTLCSMVNLHNLDSDSSWNRCLSRRWILSG